MSSGVMSGLFGSPGGGVPTAPLDAPSGTPFVNPFAPGAVLTVAPVAEARTTPPPPPPPGPYWFTPVPAGPPSPPFALMVSPLKLPLRMVMITLPPAPPPQRDHHHSERQLE